MACRCPAIRGTSPTAETSRLTSLTTEIHRLSRGRQRRSADACRAAPATAPCGRSGCRRHGRALGGTAADVAGRRQVRPGQSCLRPACPPGCASRHRVNRRRTRQSSAGSLDVHRLGAAPCGSVTGRNHQPPSVPPCLTAVRGLPLCRRAEDLGTEAAMWRVRRPACEPSSVRGAPHRHREPVAASTVPPDPVPALQEES